MSIVVPNGNFAKPVLSAVAVKLSKAKIRAIVFDKCGGKCAYCGVDLVKGFNVDFVLQTNLFECISLALPLFLRFQ